MQAGARRVYLVSEPVAAAVGAGLPISDPGANMVVDIGGGTTEVAVISLSGIVHSTSLRLGGDDMNDAIALHVRKSHGLLIGERRAEEIKIQLGSAYPQPDDVAPMPVKGRDLTSGLPKTVMVTVAEVREALREPVTAIVEAVRACLEQTPPELAADIVDKGISLTGGGALLAGLDRRVAEATQMPVHIADDSMALLQLFQSLEEIRAFRHDAGFKILLFQHLHGFEGDRCAQGIAREGGVGGSWRKYAGVD